MLDVKKGLKNLDVFWGGEFDIAFGARGEEDFASEHFVESTTGDSVRKAAFFGFSMCG